MNDRERDFLARSEAVSRRARYGLAGVAIVLLIAIGAIAYFRYEAQLRQREQAARRLAEARGRVEVLASAEVRAVPDILGQLGADRRLVRDRLEALTASSDPNPEVRRRHRLHTALALLPDEPVRRRDELARLLLADARPSELLVIRQALHDHGHAPALTPTLRGKLEEMPTELIDSQLCAAGALALFAPTDPRWFGAWHEAFQAVARPGPDAPFTPARRRPQPSRAAGAGLHAPARVRD